MEKLHGLIPLLVRDYQYPHLNIAGSKSRRDEICIENIF